MLQVVIVDDEQNAIQSLSWELSNFENEIEIVQTFTNAEEAIVFLRANDKDIDCLFLDIQMPTMDGFKFLEKFPSRSFSVIITTAYSEYGIKALRENALDYLMKPIDSDDLHDSIEKLKEIKKKHSDSEGLENFELMLRGFNDKLRDKKIVVSSDGKLIFIKPSEIAYLASDGNYSTIFLSNGKKIVFVKKLKEVHAMLPQDQFVRVHNSYVIHLDKVNEFYKTDGYVILEGNFKIPVSRQRRSEFLDKI